jgi:hypothetical protein
MLLSEGSPKTSGSATKERTEMAKKGSLKKGKKLSGSKSLRKVLSDRGIQRS